MFLILSKKKLLNLLKKLVIILFIPSILLNIFFGYKTLNQRQTNLVKVIGVIDGDTIVLENKTRLRLRHIDAPELVNCGEIRRNSLLIRW